MSLLAHIAGTTAATPGPARIGLSDTGLGMTITLTRTTTSIGAETG